MPNLIHQLQNIVDNIKRHEFWSRSQTTQSFLFWSFDNSQHDLYYYDDVKLKHIPATLKNKSRLIEITQKYPCNLVLPTHLCRIFTVSLPKISKKKLKSAIRFAVENQLAEPLEAVHIVFQKKSESANNDFEVVVINKQRFLDILNNLHELGVFPSEATVDWFALPIDKVISHKNHLIVNHARFCGAITPDLVPGGVLEGCKELVFNDTQPAKLNFPVIHLKDNYNDWCVMRLQQNCSINLLEGDFVKHNPQAVISNKEKKAFYVILAAWLVSSLSANFYSIYDLNHNLHKAKQDELAAYRAFFPDAKTTTMSKYRVQQLIDGGAGKNHKIWHVLANISKAVNQTKVVVAELQVESGMVRINIEGSAFSELDEFVSYLKGMQIKVTQTEALTKNNKAIAQLEIRI